MDWGGTSRLPPLPVLQVLTRVPGGAFDGANSMVRKCTDGHTVADVALRCLLLLVEEVLGGYAHVSQCEVPLLVALRLDLVLGGIAT
jgi:hypothetical protein